MTNFDGRIVSRQLKVVPFIDNILNTVFIPYTTKRDDTNQLCSKTNDIKSPFEPIYTCQSEEIHICFGQRTDRKYGPICGLSFTQQ